MYLTPCQVETKDCLIKKLLQNKISAVELSALCGLVDANDLSFILQHIYDLNEKSILELAALLAITAGLLDVTEKTLLLYNMAPFRIGISYCSSYWFALPKFILCGWVTLVWLASLVSGSKRRQAYVSAQLT